MLHILKEKKSRISEMFSGHFSGHGDEKCKKYRDEDLLEAVSNSHAVAPFIIIKAPRCYACTVTVNMISISLCHLAYQLTVYSHKINDICSSLSKC